MFDYFYSLIYTITIYLKKVLLYLIENVIILESID